ncbi:hypothetical protein FN846DRAFT_919559 [Sphaerosporella brunnea]|uniref:Uncharacterized protein n=1 Tax=Sphaerosporella brunnea TaxID=1250544 RepID=A0A5J5EWV4_9PEZI|nr:hypothetical protein FN846DRAFT_919559 [Sphaerosporella brunnea]
MLVTVGHCTFTGKNGSACLCISGSCISEEDDSVKASQQPCDDCGHLISMHRAFRSSFPAGEATASSPVLPSTISSPQEAAHPPALLSSSSSLAYNPRTELVAAILSRMFEHRVIHIRGTPASGKSVLLHLIREELANKYSELSTYVLNCWPQNMSDVESTSFVENLFHATLMSIFSTPDRVLLLDEAQTSYSDTGFWNGVLKQLVQPAQGAYIILFSCYSYPGHVPFPMAAETAGTPLIFADAQRIGLSWFGDPPAGMLFRKEETVALCQRRSTAKASPLIIAPDLVDWLHEMTGGHVGALVSMITIISSDRDLRKLQIISGTARLTAHDVAKVCLKDLNSFFGQIRSSLFGRGFPPDNALHNKGVASFFRAMLAKGLLPESDIWDKDMFQGCQTSFKSGWIQAALDENGRIIIYVFPSPLHEWFYSYKLVPPSPEVDFDLYPGPLELVLAVLKRFKPSQLNLEAQFGMELYRATFDLLNGNIVPSPEFGKKGCKGGGAVDFLIPGYGFGIELLIDGGELKDHYDRFLPGGQYHNMVGSGAIKKWIILDFRYRSVSLTHPDMPNLYHICYSNNIVRVLDAVNLAMHAEVFLLQN